MNSAGFTSWEGVEAYFTFAQSPGMIQFWFWLMVVLCIIPILSAIKHENKVEREYRNKR